MLFIPCCGMASQTHSSTIAIAEDNDILAVIKPEAMALTILSINDWSIQKEFKFDTKPTSIGYDNDIEAFFVGSEYNSSLIIISSSTLEQIGYLSLARSPSRLLTTTHFLLVTSKTSGFLDVYDKYNLTLLKSIHLGGSPSGISYLIAKDLIYVSDLLDGSISVIKLGDFSIASKIDMGSTATLTESVIFDKENEFGYIPQTYQNSENMNLQFDTAVFPSLSIIDLKANKNRRKKRIGLDVVDTPVGIPLTGVTFGDHIFIANYASNDITILSLQSLKLVAHIEVGHTPFGLAVDTKNSLVIVNNILDETISLIDGNNPSLIDNIKVTEWDTSTQLIQGQRLFNNSDDTRLAKDQWIACATCHFDGGNDGTSWFFPDGKRNTPSLFNSFRTAPFHWNGDLDEVQDVEFTIQDLMAGHGLSGGQPNCTPNCAQDIQNAGRSKDLDALAAYINTLQFPLAISQQNSVGETKSYRDGQTIFESPRANCITCHTGPYYTDNKNHIVDLVSPGGAGQLINTPSLLGLRNSAPYLHNGSAKTLEDVLKLSEKSENHGNVNDLSASELEDLIFFLENIRVPDEASVQTNLFTEYNEFKKDPKNVFANLELNSSIFEKNGVMRLKIDLSSAFNQSVDLYLVFLNKQNNDFFTINSDSSLSGINTLAKYKAHPNPKGLSTKNVVNFPFDPTLVVGLKAEFFAVLVKENTSIYNPSNWVVSKSLELNF